LALGGVLTLALIAGCAIEAQPRGQLMIAIDSDMSVPKDMDEVRVEVRRADGTRLPDRQIPILPSLPAPFGKPLPGTLAIVPSDAGGEAVHVRLTARWFNPDTGVSESRVVREAIAKVPTDRVAMLRMPLRWLCDGSVKPTEDGSFRSDCPNEDDTCVAGACKPSNIDENLLPDYLPSQVFGGGTPAGKGSDCLNVQTCFAQTIALEPDKRDCTIPLPAGADPRKLNVALVLKPESDGHCLDDPEKGPGKGRCYIPLDSDPDEGFVIEGKRIRLPPAACMRTNVLGIAASLGCNTKDLSIPICGPWNGWAASPSDGAGGSGASSAGGASSSGGMSTPSAANGGTANTPGEAGAFPEAGSGAVSAGGSGGESLGGAGGTEDAGAAGSAGASPGGSSGTGGSSMCLGFDDAAANVPLTLPPLP
jgi:hypothetical protein